MKQVVFLLLKYGVHLLFIFLEVICFYIIINYNQSKKEIFLNSTNLLTTKINNKVDRLEEYLRLETVNDSLHMQNAVLLKRYINSLELNISAKDSLTIDSVAYDIIPAKICNSTFNLQNNYVTLCKGSSDGITKDMGVITVNGIVGQVVKVSKNYSKVLSILHTKSRISASIKRNNAYGYLAWDGTSPREVSLKAIPKHIDVRIGDTIITSGFSTIFPRGINIGVVESFKERNNNIDISVLLFNDPSKWNITYVINNKLAQEQRALENSGDI